MPTPPGVILERPPRRRCTSSPRRAHQRSCWSCSSSRTTRARASTASTAVARSSTWDLSDARPVAAVHAPPQPRSGYQSAHAIPLRLRDSVIGAMNLFSVGTARAHRRMTSPLGQALADVATIGLLQERAVRQSGLIAEQLQTALNSRIVDRAGQGRPARQRRRRRRPGVPADARLQPAHQPAPSRHVAGAVIAREITAEELTGS